MTNQLYLVSGTVSDLNIVKGHQALAMEPTERFIAAGAGLLSAFFEQFSVSTGMMYALNDSHDVRYFECRVDNKIIAGFLPRVTFKNGDYVDFVVAEETNNIFYSYSVRRAYDNTFWLPLNCNKGTNENRKV